MLPDDCAEILEDKFARYESLLRKWQGAINLVGSETLNDFRSRHIDDSAQLVPYIPAGAKILFDFGSGAGFPGLVLAMLRPDLDVHLLESDSRKCAFLGAVSRETKTPAIIHNIRIEDADADILPLPDVIAARALAPLETLLDYALPWRKKNPGLVLLFLKGGRASAEIEQAKKAHDFSCQLYASRTDPSGGIIKIPD